MKKVTMTGPAFVKEHKKLIRVLKSGSKKVLAKEAKEQGNELRKYQRTGK